MPRSCASGSGYAIGLGLRLCTHVLPTVTPSPVVGAGIGGCRCGDGIRSCGWPRSIVDLALRSEPSLHDPLPAAERSVADFLMKVGRLNEAKAEFERAVSLTGTGAGAPAPPELSAGMLALALH